MSDPRLVSVNTHYTRSINLERDIGSTDAISAYIPTSRALRTSERIADAFKEGVAPRAWSLVGPYGSGKSSYALFLSALLQNPENPSSKIAHEIFRKADPNLADQYFRHLHDSKGYVRVLITGGPEPLGRRLVSGLASAALSSYTAKGRKPSIVGKLVKAAQSPEKMQSSDALTLLSELQEKLIMAGYKGMILVIDELGKFLEYEARHYGTNDIYLLQNLAEYACAGGKSRLYLFVLLHQSFEQYAKGLGESLKKEWSKIQGRFEEIPFVESSEQVMRIVSAAFTQNFSKKVRTELSKHVRATVEVLDQQAALPSGLSKTHAVSLFTDCYPLHPLTSLLLPALCQKVAQNERTLFSYLGSHEDHGLQDLLQKIESTKQYVYPHDIYDYFVTNQPAVLGDYLTHRRWAEVVTAIERIGDADDFALNLLKTIGILNIVGGKGGFKASPEILKTIFLDKHHLSRSLKVLQNTSVITYRKFSGEYRVWQGSDFDLEAAIEEWINNLGEFSLADGLTESAHLRPVIARRYAIKSGSLRYFEPVFIDASNYRNLQTKHNLPRILFFLATAKDEEDLFFKTVVPHFSNGIDVLALCMNGAQMREAFSEALALQKVGHSFQQLKSDPVAKREYDDRLTAADLALNSSVKGLLDHPEENTWFYDAKKLTVGNKRQLQENLSNLMEQIYHAAPIFKNELINRDKPSSQANAARNKLLLAMIESSEKRDLGIDKYPPEKSLYRALLQTTGLHLQIDPNNDLWTLSKPPQQKIDDKANIGPVWKKIDAFLNSTESNPKSFAELNAELIAPPYGVKSGVLPILYITVFQVYKDELALYENRRYVPAFTEEMLERFVKRPDEYTVERFQVDGLKAHILKEYSEVIVFDNPANATVLGFASQLAKFFGSLPDYTKRTRRGLTSRAIEVRSEFNLAKSPEKLLFDRLPEILGFKERSSDASQSDADSFSYTLKAVLGELKNAHSKMIDRQRELLAQAFNLSKSKTIGEIRKQVAHDCAGLENYTIDRAFIDQINSPASNDEEWLENLLSFLGHKPTKKWTDADQDAAEFRLAGYSRKLVDLFKLKAHELDRRHPVSKDFDVYLLRSVEKGGDVHDQVVAVDPKSREAIASTLALLRESLQNLSDDGLRLAAVAKFANEFLKSYGESNSKVNNKAEPLAGTKTKGIEK
ncbi:hypothetical protein N9M39_01075 [Halieaceae bacterium]|nr:hypothetical protein [Halieaceae bacterium]